MSEEIKPAQITAVIHDKKGRVVYCKVGPNLYTVNQMLEFYNKYGYRFFTKGSKTDPLERNVRPITRGSVVYFASEPDVTTANNLDYLPQATLD